MKKLILLALFGASFIAARIDAQVTVLYNNDFPTGDMAAATRPESAGKFEIESADDFLLPTGAHITGATFTGLLPSGVAISDVANVRVEIYRVFPNDSDVGRTSGPPTFSTPQVPTRVNSPSDVALLDRSSNDGNLSFTAALLSATFTANNSVQPGGIHPQPGQTTGGDGAITGEEVHFDIDLTNPLNLPPGHYFFVPQVELSGADDNFFWLSATRPLVPPSTVFTAGPASLDSRCESGSGLASNWSRHCWWQSGADFQCGVLAYGNRAGYRLHGFAAG